MTSASMRVHLGVELEAGDAVAEVVQRGAVVLEDQAALLAHERRQRDARAARSARGFAASTAGPSRCRRRRSELRPAASISSTHGGLRCPPPSIFGDRCRRSRSRPRSRTGRAPSRSPSACAPSMLTMSSAISPMRRAEYASVAAGHLPRELGGAVVAASTTLRTRSFGSLDALGRADRRRTSPSLRAVLERLRGRASTMPSVGLLVEAAAGLVAEHASSRPSSAMYAGHLEVFAVLVVLSEVLVAVLRRRARRCRGRRRRRCGTRRSWGGPCGAPVIASTSSTAKLAVERQLDEVHHGEHADAVGDEVRRVLAEDDALAEHVVAEARARRRAIVGSVSCPATSSRSFM